LLISSRFQGFAAALQHALKLDEIPPGLEAELKGYIGELSVGKSATAATAFEELDNYGTALWNSTLRMKCQDATPDGRNNLSLGIITAQYLDGTRC